MTKQTVRLGLSRETVRELGDAEAAGAGVVVQTLACNSGPCTTVFTSQCITLHQFCPTVQECIAVTGSTCASIFAPCQVVSGFVCP